MFSEDDLDFDVYVTTSSLEVRPDQTVSLSAFLEFRLGGNVEETEFLGDSGTWQLVGNEFSVALSGGMTITGIVEGRTLTLQVPPDNTIPASVWVYER